MATDTGLVFSTISWAILFASSKSSFAGCIDLIKPPSFASSGENTRPEKVHSNALLMPTTLGKNQLEAASGTKPRRAKTKPNLASSLAILISMGRVIVTPTPTAGPLKAAMTGFGQSKMARVVLPPPSRIHSGSSFIPSVSPLLFLTSLLNVLPPAPRSAPAQNPLPAPVTIITLMSSSFPALSKASIRSACI